MNFGNRFSEFFGKFYFNNYQLLNLIKYKNEVSKLV